MEAKLDETIQYGQSVKRDSAYRFTKLVQNTGGQEVTVNSGQTSTFEIPSVAFNLAKSFLIFDQKAPSQVDLKTRLFRDTAPFQRVELYTRGGTYLMDVTNFASAYQTMAQRNMSVDHFFTSSDGVLIQDITTPNFAVTTTVDPFTVDGHDPVPDPITATSTVVSTFVATGTTPLKLKVGATEAAVNETKWRIPLREMYNTILSLDKTILLNEVLSLRITWASSAEMGWQARNDGTTNLASLTGNVDISNLALYLAQETNQSVINDLTALTRSSGMSILVPYLHVYKTNLSTSSHAVSIRLSRGHGISLERVYTGFGSGSEGTSVRYANSILGRDITSFYSLLDSKRLQEFDIDVASGDYSWTRRSEHQGRVVGLNVLNDSSNFAWVDSWCGDDLECAIHQQMGGLSLDIERKYDLYVKCVNPSAVNYYTVAVCQKQLMIAPGGISIM